MFSFRIPTRIAALALALAIPSLAFAGDDDDFTENKSGYLGVRLQRIEGGLAEALDLKEDGGVLIGQVIDGSPADAAGVEAGDIVLKVDGQAVGTPDALAKSVRVKSAGSQVSLDVLRDGKPQTLTVKLGESPASGDAEGRELRWTRRQGSGDRGDNDAEDDGDDNDDDVRIFRGPGAGGREWIGDEHVRGERGYLGVMSQPISEELAGYFGVKDGKGALVSEVVKDSPAAKLGLQAGDVITKVDGEAIDGPGELMRAVRKIGEAKDVDVEWIREKRVKTGKAAIELREGWAGGTGGMPGREMREMKSLRGMHELRNMPKRMRSFERHPPPPGGADMSPRAGGPDRDEMAAMRNEMEALRKELQKLKEEVRGE